MLDMFFTHFFTHIFCTPLKNYSLCHQYQPSITHITTIKFQLVTNFGPLSFALGRGLLKREMLGTETCETYFQSDKTKPTWEQQCRGWQRCSTRRWWSLSSSFGLASRREAPERCGCLYFTHACGSDAISTGNVNRWHLLRYHNYCFTIFDLLFKYDERWKLKKVSSTVEVFVERAILPLSLFQVGQNKWS